MIVKQTKECIFLLDRYMFLAQMMKFLYFPHSLLCEKEYFDAVITKTRMLSYSISRGQICN